METIQACFLCGKDFNYKFNFLNKYKVFSLFFFLKSLCVCLCVFSGLFCPWDFPARILEWAAVSSSRGIFLTQGLNYHLLSLLHCRWILYC